MAVITWESPSNIALVKYWGKYGQQLPRNASISFTLSASHTITTIAYSPRTLSVTPSISFDFLFEHQPQPIFAEKVGIFLEALLPDFPFLAEYHLHIATNNSFPHSAGIASSAAGMSALVLCLCDMERQLHHYSGVEQASESEFWKRASYYSRLGSGSACRSVYPHAAVWGKHPAVPNSDDTYAVPFTSLHEVFAHYHDDILIVSKEEKKVSSRVGHSLMENNPYASARYIQANDHLSRLVDVLKCGDLDEFCRIVEQEALTLHALMMTSSPSFILMHPQTLAIIEKVREFRHDTQIPICFTLDAGPNLHLLYPDKYTDEVGYFIKAELEQLCQSRIADHLGEGPKCLSA